MSLRSIASIGGSFIHFPSHSLARTRKTLRMSQPLVIVAKIEANPDSIELIQSELQKLIPPTLMEPGCIQYDLHQDNENPAVFLFYEIWATRDMWQDHMNSDHIEQLLKTTEGAIASLEVHEMSKV